MLQKMLGVTFVAFLIINHLGTNNPNPMRNRIDCHVSSMNVSITVKDRSWSIKLLS